MPYTAVRFIAVAHPDVDSTTNTSAETHQASELHLCSMHTPSHGIHDILKGFSGLTWTSRNQDDQYTFSTKCGVCTQTQHPGSARHSHHFPARMI